MDSLELKSEIIEFDHLLCVDGLFADYFNNFCEINFFPDKLLYCSKSRHFLKVLTGKRKVTNWYQADNLVIDRDSFVNAFKSNWLKYFTCSYQYLEYRIAKLISQVELDLISRKIISKTFINVLLSTGITTEDNDANTIKTICSCWDEKKNQNMVTADDLNDWANECQQLKCELCDDGDQTNARSNQFPLKKDISFTLNSEKTLEDEILRANFLSCKDVSEFYNFLPSVAAQPLWIIWIEVQKILLMQKYCNWFSSKRALQKLRETYYHIWTYCLRLKRLIERFCSQDEWNVEEMTSVADGAIHCLLTYWVPRYLLNRRKHSDKPPNCLLTIHFKSNFQILCKYSNSLHLHKDSFEIERHRKEIVTENKERKLRTTRSVNCEPIELSHVDDGSDLFSRKSKSCRSRNNSSKDFIVDEKEDKAEDAGDDGGGTKRKCLRQKLKRLVSADEFVGNRFYTFLKESNNQDWLNKFCFLKECQHLKAFSTLSTLGIKTSEIFARFLSSGSEEKLSSLLEKSVEVIHSDLKFPRSEMFEKMERKVEDELLDAVKSFQGDVVESLKELKYLGPEQQLKHKEDEMHVDSGTNSGDSENIHQHPALKSNHTLKSSKAKTLMKTVVLKNMKSFHGNGLELENFKNFLVEQKAALDFFFWQDIETYERLAEGSEDRRFKAEEIFRLYVNDKYFLASNGPASKQQLEENTMKCYEYNPALADANSIDSFLGEAQICVQKRLENTWLPLYLSQRESETRRKPVVSGLQSDGRTTEKDLPKSLKMEKINEIFFRQLLLDNAAADNFIQFAALEDEKHEMDVQFLAEVFKYEELWHNNVGMSSIQHKADAIVNSFISSHFPPSIQISIEQELADKIQSRSKKPTFTLFKEAQKLVLASLSKHFGEFEKLRSQMSSQELFLRLTDERKKKQASMLRSRLKKLSSKESVEKLMMTREESLTNGASDADLISWTYSEYMIHLFDARLRQEQEKQVRPDRGRRTRHRTHE